MLRDNLQSSSSVMVYQAFHILQDKSLWFLVTQYSLHLEEHRASCVGKSLSFASRAKGLAWESSTKHVKVGNVRSLYLCDVASDGLRRMVLMKHLYCVRLDFRSEHTYRIQASTSCRLLQAASDATDTSKQIYESSCTVLSRLCHLRLFFLVIYFRGDVLACDEYW